MTDLLTIALPVYKRTDFVREALDSAINQTERCRVLLIDNHSPHYDFKEILESYNDPHATYVRMDETVPQDANFNNCFKYSETPWVTILHDDDMLHCQFVENTRKILEKYGDRVGGITYRSHVGEKVWDGISTPSDDPLKVRKLEEPFFFFNHLTPFPGVVLKKDRALELGGFTNELFPIADFDFWYRYSMKEKMFLVDNLMAYYRISPDQSTNQVIDGMINKIYEYRLRLIEESKHRGFLTRLGLEDTRLMNIDYFMKTYTEMEMPDKIVNEEKMKRARRLLSCRILRKLVRDHKKRLSFTPAD